MKRVGLHASLGHLGRVHAGQRGWRSWLRVGWWLLLLPVALACWAAVQQSRSRQLVAWALTGVALLAWIGGMNGGGTPRTAIQASPRLNPIVAAPRSATATTATTSVATPRVEPPTTTPPSPEVAPVATTVLVPTTAATQAAVVAPPVPAPVKSVQAPVTAPRTSVAKPPTAAPLPVAQAFANCTELRAAYPHGVGMPGAVDHVSGSTRPVTTFTRSASLYEANSGSDRDGDGIACEQH